VLHIRIEIAQQIGHLGFSYGMLRLAPCGGAALRLLLGGHLCWTIQQVVQSPRNPTRTTVLTGSTGLLACSRRLEPGEPRGRTLLIHVLLAGNLIENGAGAAF
jgi:hypothetical protein